LGACGGDSSLPVAATVSLEWVLVLNSRAVELRK
jgi:hypothetical protein